MSQICYYLFYNLLFFPPLESTAEILFKGRLADEQTMTYRAHKRPACDFWREHCCLFSGRTIVGLVCLTIVLELIYEAMHINASVLKANTEIFTFLVVVYSLLGFVFT